MTRAEAMAVVVEAAGNWANEIREYIEPAEPGEEYGWAERADQIELALRVLTAAGEVVA